MVKDLIKGEDLEKLKKKISHDEAVKFIDALADVLNEPVLSELNGPWPLIWRIQSERQELRQGRMMKLQLKQFLS